MELESILLPGIEAKRPIVIAGPCSAETEEQVMDTARQLAAKGQKIFRAGIWKPRTKPGGFEGIGVEGLAWLKEVKKETGMYVSTEVATAKHVYECLKAGIDILWVGARTTANPFAVQEIADALKGVDIPVLVKNPVNPDLELWIGALERISNAGLKRLGAIHRGFSSYDKKIYRNLPQWHIPIELRRRIPNLPIFCDPSHIGGKRELIAPLCQQAMDLNFDGLIVESHCNPDCAWSDASQQVTPDVLDYILNLLVIRTETQTTESLSQLRKQIDECDDNIIQELAKRMRIAREIGTYKKEHGITVLQAGRYNEILEKRGAQGEQCGMDAEFMKKILMLGGSLYQVYAIKEAVRLGYYVISCDYLPNNPGHKYAHEYYNVSTTDKNAVLELAKRLQVDGIVAYASDPAAPTAAFVCEKLGLPTSPYRSVEILSKKDLFRQFLADNGFNVPKAQGFSSYEEALSAVDKFELPVMVKPVDSSGSKGINKMTDISQLKTFVDDALSYSRDKRFLIEEFIEKKGYQISGDAFSVDGQYCSLFVISR